MFIHVKEFSRLGYRKITVVTVDTDVVVISLYALWDVYPILKELWIEFDEGKHRKWILAHIYTKTLGEEICRALLNFLNMWKKGMEDLACISRSNRIIYKAWTFLDYFLFSQLFCLRYIYGHPLIWNSIIIFRSFICLLGK